MERILLSPTALSIICSHCTTHEPLPPQLAKTLSRFFAARFCSPIVLHDKIGAALAEQMLGVFADDPGAEELWWEAWQQCAVLPALTGVAATCGQVRAVTTRLAPLCQWL
jgi:hypothetical protein